MTAAPQARAVGRLAAAPDTVLWGRLPCADDRPVVTIDAGDSLWIDTVSHEGILEDQGRDPVAFFACHGIAAADVLADAVRVAAEVEHDPDVDGPHVVTGPVRVRGARVGDILSVTVLDLEMRAGYGIVSNRHGRGALPAEFPRGGSLDPVSILCTVDPAGSSGPAGAPGASEPRRGSMPAGPGDHRRVRFPLRPFLGTMGVAVAGHERAHSVPPGPHGGNIDISLLGVGSTLHIPVQVDGALAYVGDPHYAQGDGEVALTAFEAPLRAHLRFDVIPREAFVVPRTLWAETSELLVPIGLDADLGEAMRAATRAAVNLLADAGMDPSYAYAYLSAAGDFAVSQVVDRVCGVHGTIRKADLVELLQI
ncbi:acetamidase/formamidase family protein [Sanguibacter antarcticus]|uniref:Acetamidase/formamidase n=1 Tax=Sanguibacter antarcticus TaxID=372484 RepID=A0A2A9E611_9MICO|nr:acetamidase/formamidase family protein [Sanguibacter antarcticus]PFG34398.1 acetamidase/formamidase [Sanguibacter antarcticus]